MGILGKPLKVDQATKKRDKLHFARVLVEMNLSKDFLDSIEYEDAYDNVVVQPIVYEWKPISCDICKGMGHSQAQCTMKTKAVWRPKETVQKQGDQVVDNDSFQVANRSLRPIRITVHHTVTGSRNSYAVLTHEKEKIPDNGGVDAVVDNKGEGNSHQLAHVVGGEGDPPDQHG